MDNRVEEIKKRLKSNTYFVNPPSDSRAVEDVGYLLNLLEDQATQIEALQRKNKVLSNHVLELTQEMENIRADFGDGR